MNKRNIKYIKLIAGTLAVASAFSACAAKRNEEYTRETVYVYVTATPTPNPDDYTFSNETRETHPVEETTSTSETSTATQGGLINHISEITPTPVQQEDDGWWADDTWFFASDDPYTLPTIVDDGDGLIEDGEQDSLLRIYNAFARIDNTINNFDYEQTRDEAISEVRELINFIFYGAEMNGVTFEELTDRGRQEAYERLQALDARLMEIDPDYKERLGEIYNVVRNFVVTNLERARQAFNSHIDIDVNVYPNGETAPSEETTPTMGYQQESKSLRKSR